MKRVPIITRALAAISTLFLAQSAMAVVYVNFEQDGTDVLMSFEGTLSLPAPAGFFDRFETYAYILPDGILALDGYVYIADDIGSATTTSLSTISTNVFEDISGVFGFGGTSLYWGSDEVTAGGSLSPTQFTLTRSNNGTRFRNTTLAAMNATSLTPGQVLWTANGSGDTIRVGTVSVPEPSSLLLGSLGALGLLRRRR